MGAVKKFLAERTLRDREPHNSRLFVDLCENIHIHFREYRLIFSIDEYLEFVDIINRSTRDVRNYLYNNPDYCEEKFPTTIMVASGKFRQHKFLQNSPKPHESAYHNHLFAIELQEEHITDEIHVHWRDLRIVLNRENFKDVAQAFTEAHHTLLAFEQEHNYQRQGHFDRALNDLNTTNLDVGRVQGVESISLERITSYWFPNFEDLRRDWKRNPVYIENLKARYVNHEPVPPLLLAKPNEAGIHFIVNGHHRFLAAIEAGRKYIDAVVMPLTFEQTEKLRKAELLVKEFDQETGYSYGLTSFLNDYVAFKTNRFYTNDFQRRMQEMNGAAASQNADGMIKRFTKKIGGKLRSFRKRVSRTARVEPPTHTSRAA